MLPIAGGNITGNLGVAGTTTLTGTLTALGNSQINTLDVAGASNFATTLDVAGQATFADGVEIDGVDAADFATKTYVDEAVASGGLWQGTWNASTNTPDLTQTTLQRNGWGWTVVTPDPTAPFDVPATPVIPGVSGQTVYNGDHVIWSDAASTFELVSGSSISRQEAEDLFPLKEDALIRGVAGNYVQGTDFTDFQTFLDENVNNHFFEADLQITLNTPNATPIMIGNVQFSRRAQFTIIGEAQVASSFTVANVKGMAQVVVRAANNATFYSGNGYFDSTVVRMGGDGVFGGTTNAQHGYIILGEVGSTLTQITNLSVGFASSAFTSSNNTPVAIGTLTVNGTFHIAAANTGLTVTTLSTGGAGQIIDNRPGRPLETYLRWPPEPWEFTTPGVHTWICPRTGRYEMQVAAGGGGGVAWQGNPVFGTTGSVPRYTGSASGGLVAQQMLCRAGEVFSLTVSKPSPGQVMWVPSTWLGDTSIIGVPDASRYWGIWAASGDNGYNTGGGVCGGYVLASGGLPPGHGMLNAPTTLNGTNHNGTSNLGAASVTRNGASWKGPNTVRITSGAGGSAGNPGGPGMITVAYVSPT